MQNKMTYALLKNHDGKFVAPDDETFQAAAAERRLDQGAGLLPADHRPARQGSWPITGATFILMHKKQDKPEIARPKC